MNPSELRKFIIQWNNRFPLDRQYRVKHNIAFMSDEHRALNQFDIYLQWFEDQLYDEFVAEATVQIEKEKEFSEGKWLRDTNISTEEEDALWNSVDIDNINSPIKLVD